MPHPRPVATFAFSVPLWWGHSHTLQPGQVAWWGPWALRSSGFLDNQF